MQRNEWLQKRRCGFGSTDIAAALGLSPYKTPREIWQEKTGRAEGFTGNMRTEIGLILETHIAEHYARINGVSQLLPRQYEVKSHNDSVVMASVDYLTPELNLIVECKTVGEWAAKNWIGDVPEQYYIQAIIQMGCWGIDACDIHIMHLTDGDLDAVALAMVRHADIGDLVSDAKYTTLRVDFDEALFSRLVSDATKWWADYVIADVPPPLTVDELNKLSVSDSTIETNLRVTQDVYRIAVLAGELKKLKEEKEKLEDAVKLYMGDNSTLTINGETAITWNSREGIKFDAERFALDNPTLYREYSTQAITRTFLRKNI